jgi:predicted ferric reductase
MKNKILFLVVWVLSLLTIPLTVLDKVNFIDIYQHLPSVFGLILRILGMSSYVLLFWQVVSGAFFDEFEKKLGKWFLNFHIWQGIAGFLLAFLHPVSLLLIKYFIGAGLDPIAVFLGFCLFCEKKRDFYITLGRVGLVFFAVGIVVGIFRNATHYMRANWRKFHLLNYIVFIAVGAHGYLLGNDFKTSPFLYFAILANLVVVYTIIHKLPKFIKQYKGWLNS